MLLFTLQVGIALKPATPVETLLPHVGSVDMVLVMMAEPGVKGQEGVTNALHKVETLQQKFPDLLIKTDGWDEPSGERVSSTKREMFKLFSADSSQILSQKFLYVAVVNVTYIHDTSLSSQSYIYF